MKIGIQIAQTEFQIWGKSGNRIGGLRGAISVRGIAPSVGTPWWVKAEISSEKTFSFRHPRAGGDPT